MPQSVLAVGFHLAIDAIGEAEFDSNSSLLDWDVILFRPSMGEYISYGDQYKGKPCLNDRYSFKLLEACKHWRDQIKEAMAHGKTVIIFLPDIEEIYVANGDRGYTGNGRNRKESRIVVPLTNYDSIPLSLNPTSVRGSSMKLASAYSHLLSPYWSEFGEVSEYKVFLSNEFGNACILTKHGDKPVGAVIRSEGSAGALVLLPDIDFSADDFYVEQNDEFVWSQEAKQFAARFISAVVALDTSLRSTAIVTPEPHWASDTQYTLKIEQELRSKLLKLQIKLAEAQTQKEDIQQKIANAGGLRALLYEKGQPLENAIIQALQKMGFSAQQYKDASSEFDVVFECPEGRFLGEAEGKDSKAINVDKLRQLSMNIHEDLQRDEIHAPAKGVLFGNGYRLAPPMERDVQFTSKCLSAAQSSSTALVATVDLYTVAKYLSDQPDDYFAKKCREAMLIGVGIISFPPLPSSERLAVNSDYVEVETAE